MIGVDHKCEKCSDHCSDCKNKNECNKCDTDYFLENKKCVKPCSFGFYPSEKKCLRNKFPKISM